MIQSFIEGLGMGIVISLLIGQLFFTILDTTIERGKKAGLAVIIGIWCSDIFLAIISYKGLHNIWEPQVVENVIGMVGSVILVAFGSFLFFTRYSKQENGSLSGLSLVNYWLRGLIINTFNPFTLVFWTSLALTKKFEPDNFSTRAGFYTGLLGIIAVVDVIKVLIAARLRLMLTAQGVNNIRKFSGAAIALFGVLLFVRIIFM